MPREPLSTAELLQRAQGLQRLGNSAARIRAVLQNLEATPEQIEEVMASIESVSRQRQSSDSRFIWLLGGITVLFFVVVFFATYWRFVPTSAQNIFVPVPTANPRAKATNTLSVQSIAKTLAPGIPVEMLPSLIPSNIPANFMLATPAVQRQPTTGVQTKCPKSPGQAAALFGGDASNWTYDADSNGWTMTQVGNGLNIRVPEGMRGGYLLLVNGPEMRSVDGPATLKDINFIAITCEK
jgi:hypothetical protein